MNTRRKLVIALGVGALSAPLGSFSQQQNKVWRIGVLTPDTLESRGPLVEVFKWAMHELALLTVALIAVGGHAFWLRLVRARGVRFIETMAEQVIVREGVFRVLHASLPRLEANSNELFSLMEELLECRVVAAQAKSAY